MGCFDIRSGFQGSIWKPGDDATEPCSHSSQQAAQASVGPSLKVEAAAAQALEGPGPEHSASKAGRVRVQLAGRAVVEGGPSLSVPPVRGKETTS
jgi:hypothetical protein